jgi:L-threonylcarbamoyladenylate synthase
MTIISNDIAEAVKILNQEDIVAIPTETVYGLAGNIYSEKAIRKIFEVKQRPFFNPLIIHIHSIDQIEEIASEFPLKAQELASAFWPGPLTLILAKNSIIPDIITAGMQTVGIRMPNHPITLNLLKQLSFPLAAPSANPFNRISPTHSSHVEDYFKHDIKMVLEGGICNNGIESTIIGFEDKDQPTLFRLGSISIEEIEEVIGKIKIHNQEETAPIAPGMLAKHYAPRTKTYLVNNVQEFIQHHENKRIGVIRFSENLNLSSIEHIEVLSTAKNLKEAASKLYDTLHKLDKMNLDMIVAEVFPDHGLGKSINDRLQRATK